MVFLPTGRIAVLIAAFLVYCSVASPAKWQTPSWNLKVKESIVSPLGWVKHSYPLPTQNIVLRIGLPQPNFTILEKHLYEISDPDHERYGKHLSKEEVEGLVAPHEDSIFAVNEWLTSHGIMEGDIVRSPARDWVTINVPVGLVEKMLNTTYLVWKHISTGDYVVRTTSYSLPDSLHEHVDLIQPTTIFSRFKGARSLIAFEEDAEPEAANSTSGLSETSKSNPAIDPSCNKTMTVSCLQQLYNAVGYTPSGDIGNSIGITGYLGEFANMQDLQTFFTSQVPAAVNSSFKFISVNGGINNQSLSAAGSEANLDVQYAFGLSFPIPGTFYSTPGSPPFIPDLRTPTDTNEPYTDWLDFILSHPNPPLVISTSYADDEQSVPESFAQRACAGFAQLGARGVSLIFGSGDGGVGDGNANATTQQCISNDGRNVTRFLPSFPSSCPFVTSVGATDNINPEVAVSRFFSGGGFSNCFNRPSYQEAVVQKYLDALPKGIYSGLFNPSGRAYPDVAAQGDRFRIVVGGKMINIGGTSASSPTFAGFVALLNDARLKAIQPPLGFLNPMLYKRGVEGFTDITIGHNSGCGTPGFNTSIGWDPVTGLGTPNFGKLKEIVTSL